MRERDEFLWLGNHPATDLINTEPIIDGEQVELLPDVHAVVSWTKVAGVASYASSLDVANLETAPTLSFVRRLRAALRAALETATFDSDATHHLNEILGEAPGALHVEPSSGSTSVSLRAAGSAAQLRVDMAAAAVDIFRREPSRVRRCASPACALMFLDVSKSGRRRWCDMSTCGNRAKAAAHHARTKGRESSTSDERHWL